MCQQFEQHVLHPIAPRMVASVSSLFAFPLPRNVTIAVLLSPPKLLFAASVRRGSPEPSSMVRISRIEQNRVAAPPGRQAQVIRLMMDLQRDKNLTLPTRSSLTWPVRAF